MKKTIESTNEKKPIRLIGLRIATFIVLTVITAILLWWFISTLSLTDVDKAISLTFFLVYGMVIIGIGGYGIAFLISLVALIISIVNKKTRNGKTSQIVLQIIITLLPIILWFLILLLVKLL